MLKWKLWRFKEQLLFFSHPISVLRHLKMCNGSCFRATRRLSLAVKWLVGTGSPELWLVGSHLVDSSTLERAVWIQRGNLKNVVSFLSWINLNTLQHDTRAGCQRGASPGHCPAWTTLLCAVPALAAVRRSCRDDLLRPSERDWWRLSSSRRL